MIGSFIIVFREILEAALVIVIVATAIKGLRHRGRWIALGVALGVGGAIAIAAGIGEISQFADGSGQEIFSAGILFTAGLMLAGHNLWMAKQGRHLAGKLKALGSDVLAGRESLTVLITVTALAVLREGSETALFLYGIAASGTDRLALLGGGLLGLAAGVAIGLVLFAGLSRIPMKNLFRVSGILILFIAAGMIARGVEFLVQVGHLPALIDRVWNSGWMLSGNSLAGRSLGALVGYTPAPSLMQVLAWIASFVIIGGLMLARSGRLRFTAPHAAAAAALMLTLTGLGPVSTPTAHAGDFTVYAPSVSPGENEIEARAYTGWNGKASSGDQRSFKLGFGRNFTERWFSEFYVAGAQRYGGPFKLEEFEWENRLQLTPQGKYWVDVGLLNEIEIPRFAEAPYEVKFGPLFGKDIGRFTMLLNLIASHQYGRNAEAGVELEYRARLLYRWRQGLSPLLEAYGQPIGKIGAWGTPRQLIGPGLTGRITTGPGKSLRYAVLVLRGTGRAAAGTTLVFRLEYEFY